MRFKKLLKTLINIYKFIFENNYNTTLLLFILLIFKLFSMYLIEGQNFLFNDGWYYSNIARSILSGHGYANPFGADTGPTAWVPPLLVYYIIPFIYFLGDNFKAFFLIDIFQVAEISLCFLFLLKAWDLTRFKKNNLLFLIIFRYLLLACQVQAIRMVNDLSVYLLISSIIIFSLLNFIYHGKSFGWLLILSLIIPLCAPIFAPGYVVILLLLYLSFLNNKFSITKFTFFPINIKFNQYKFYILALAFILPVSIWGYRNYKVFHKIVITKSNSSFEFYLSNICDYDGILSSSTILKYHPDCNQDVYAKDIKKMGEIKWMEKYDTYKKVYLSNNMKEYIHKIIHRTKNCYIFNLYDNDDIQTDIFKNISLDTLHLLDNSNLVHKNRWICLDIPENQVLNKLKAIFPTNYKIYYEDWNKSKKIMNQVRYSYNHILMGFLLTIIPLLCILWLIFLNRKKDPIFVLVISLVYIIFTIPYIIISHQTRYQQPLIGLQAFLLSIVITQIIYNLIESRRLNKLIKVNFN